MADRSALYSTIATILPLFALALLAEQRIGIRERSTEPGLDVLIGITFIVAASIGELGALSALAGHPTHSNRVAAELGIGFAGVALYADLIWTQVTAYAATGPPPWRRRLVATFALLLISAGAAVLILFWLTDAL